MPYRRPPGIRSISREAEMPTRRQHGTRWISTRAMSHDGCRRLQRNIDSGSRFCCPADSADHDFWRSGGRVHQLQRGVGASSGASATDFRNSIAYGAGQSAGVGLLPRSSRACSPAGTAGLGHPPMESIQRASAWAGPAGTSVAASVNPYLTGRGRLLDPATHR